MPSFWHVQTPLLQVNSSSGWWNCWDVRIIKTLPFSIVNQLVCLCIQGTWESGTSLRTLINIWSPATAMVSFDSELSSLSLSEMISADLILLTQSITLSSIWDLHYVSVTFAYLTGIVLASSCDESTQLGRKPRLKALETHQTISINPWEEVKWYVGNSFEQETREQLCQKTNESPRSLLLQYCGGLLPWVKEGCGQPASNPLMGMNAKPII